MCGIFGFTGHSSWKTSVLLQALCIADEVRGQHSTGIVVQTSTSDFFMSKKALRGKAFVAKGYCAFLFNRKYGNAIGHNRFATAGAVNDRNAHPFAVKVGVGKWNFGVHNGIVGEKAMIAREYGVRNHEVDSAVALGAIGKLQFQGYGVIDAIEEVTNFISPKADFAFAYLNGTEKAVYLWRSPDRPLTVIDARRLNLGRWFCSTSEIFKDAWSILRGALGDLKKVSKFEAVPYRLYRVADDGEFEVEPVRELKHTSRLTWYGGVESIFDPRTPGGSYRHRGSRHSSSNQRDLFGDGDSDVFQGRVNCRPKGEIES
ncbi:MAG: hypothetical protein RBT20_14760 [Syntrophales bacterium]|jgi:hypothetical protein|nr:hypothetical protein [Syntrophales bacterium]